MSAAMPAEILVCEPYATPATLTWVSPVRGVVDRRFVLNDGDSDLRHVSSAWLAAIEPLIARQGRAPQGVALVSWAWPDLAADAPWRSRDLALLAALTGGLDVSGHLVDEAGARGYGEACFGVGAQLRDQVHVGVGVRAAGVRMNGRWRVQPDGQPWRADGLMVAPHGMPHGGRGRLRDATWPGALAAAAALHGHNTAVASGSLDASAALRPWLDAMQRGEGLAAAVVDDAGHAIGVALGGLLNIVDVPDVVLHVPVERLRDRLIEAAQRTIARHSFASLRAGLTWHAPTLADDAVALGAARICVARLCGRSVEAATSARQTSARQTSVRQTSVRQTSVRQTSVRQTSVRQAAAADTPAQFDK